MCTLDGCGSHEDLPPIVVAETDRRLFLAGLGTLPLAAVLADPALAQSAAATLEPVTITTAIQNKTVHGFMAKPAQLPAPAVILFHEWWGLNDQIKAVAAELAQLGYIAIAVNLFDKPAVSTPEEAKAQVAAVDNEALTDAVSSWVFWARDLTDSTEKVGTIGWCFGGAWSLNASIAAPVDATVIYYGNVTRTPDQLKNLVGPVLGQFGSKDQSINQAMVEGFEKAMADAGKASSLTVYWYDADHAFANPTGARYDAEDAATAWKRTTDFFTANLS